MKTIVVFNMRGGIGKTTTAVTLAESLAFFSGFRVLLADADPQRNASHRLCELALVNECSLAKNGRNISKYLSDAIVKNHLPDPRAYITERCGTIHGEGQVDLLMGSHDTLDADRHFAGKCTTDGDHSLFSKLGAAFEYLATGTEYDILIVEHEHRFSKIGKAVTRMM
jgi:cellulose biosynthesis protein BcsQ